MKFPFLNQSEVSVFSRDLKFSFSNPQSLFDMGSLIPAFNMFFGRSSVVISGIDSIKFLLKSTLVAKISFMLGISSILHDLL